GEHITSTQVAKFSVPLHLSGFRQKMLPESVSGTGQPGGLWRDIPGRRGLNGERRTEYQGRHTGNDGSWQAKRRCALQPGGRCFFAGVQ
ncbi:hypothetical protein, partial [Klebsiella sp. S69]|uniref:hypothetical protein n=1 Tax=Klebsiella sp. S69 TaxID=2767439 RepID=UPI001D0FD759